MADSNAQRPDLKRKEYEDALPTWDQATDAAAGEMAVKAKTEQYLPKPNPTDVSRENTDRYEQYLKRAVYYNATGRTLAALVGLAFGKAPEIELPADIAYAMDDINGGGVSLVQQAQKALSHVLLTGRGGLLADHPPTTGPTSRADQLTGGVRPFITHYPAAAIINWRTMRRAGKTILSMIVLAETYEVVDGFETKCQQQYRVLKLDPNYVVEVWREKKIAKTTSAREFEIVETITPLNGDGRPWTEIPFQFIGAQNNDWEIDDAPLYSLSCVNIAHYRNSADYEESVYVIGQPQVWVMGVSEEWVKIWKQQGIYFGSRAVGAGPPGASVELLQPAPNTLAHEAMQDKEKQMAALGARLLVEGAVPKTASQQDSEDTVAHSVLSLCCQNVSDAYRKALGWFAEFARTSGQIEFSMSTDFSKHRIDAQELSSLIELVQSGKMPESDFWARLRQAGLIAGDKDDDAIREEISAQEPTKTGDALDGEGNDSKEEAA